MPWASKKKMTAKTTINRNFPIPNEGGSRPAQVGVFNEVVISRSRQRLVAVERLSTSSSTSKPRTETNPQESLHRDCLQLT